MRGSELGGDGRRTQPGRKLLSLAAYAGPVIKDSTGSEPRIPPGATGKPNRTLRMGCDWVNVPTHAQATTGKNVQPIRGLLH
jgi:hypothetical protein